MLRWLSLWLLVALATGCSDFDFKVNEKVVFSPRPPFSDFDIPDEALRSCVEQAIADNTVTAAAQLQVLNCSSAGIEILDGLATFTGLTRLDLASNQISSLAELSALSTLQVLDLGDNNIVDPVPLFDLPALLQLKLTGNSGLKCPPPTAFTTVEEVILPVHCQRQ
jgi:Leucine-rich repeat (LRR) protein